jgi:Glyoxalase-like domain
MPRLEFDHLVVAANSLEAGAAFVLDRLGLETGAGGRHAPMGTHNRLASLGPGEYLEVIAVDPDATAPDRPRWFGLDQFSGGPRLVHWVVRVVADGAKEGAVEGAVEGAEASAEDRTAALETLRLPDHGPVHRMTRGSFSWQITIPDDGALPGDGLIPTLIAWDAGSGHPSDTLGDQGFRLVGLEGRHPRPAGIELALGRLGLGAGWWGHRLGVEPGPVRLRAELHRGSNAASERKILER